MFAEIITIGDEILIGQVVDTNSAWIAKQLNLLGIQIKQISSISDTKEHIIKALDEAKSRVDLILITGGLGPTRDDITKNTLCEYFDTQLVFDENIFENVKQHFSSAGVKMPKINREQAKIPKKCVSFKNIYGTAPGMWFETNKEKRRKIFISMPGVPYEMKAMMENEILPKIKHTFDTPTIIHRTVMIQGIPESALSEKLSDWENNLPISIKLAYLPSPGMIRLRLSAVGDDEKELLNGIEKQIDKLKNIIPDYLCSTNNEKLEEVIGQLLKKQDKTLSTAESCTGGYIAHLITSIAGSSDYFKGSVVSYSNEVKINTLGVSSENLEKYGAVSRQVVEAMAKGVKAKLNTDYAVATSGIAGPSGGTPENPVGTVWIAVATSEKVVSKQYFFGENRERNIRKTALTGLSMLRKRITK